MRKAINVSEGGFRLREDLASLQRCREPELVNARVFYCARTMEGLAVNAMRRIDMKASSLFMNLNQLGHLNLLSKATMSAGHALRHLGNTNRHALRMLDPSEGLLAETLLSRFVGWHLRQFEHLEDPNDLLEKFFPGSQSGVIGQLLARLDATRINSQASVEWIIDANDQLLESATLTSVAAELLLYRGRNAESEALLTRGLKRYPTEERLLQLMVLHHQWFGRIENALSIVESESWRRCDTEAYGLEAAVYRRLGRSCDPRFLSRAMDIYQRGWQASEHQDAYLGINAAAMNMELGNPTVGHQIAKNILGILADRSKRIAKQMQADATLRFLTVWDHLTFAHAQLLIGDLSGCRTTYQDAFERQDCVDQQKRRALSELDHSLKAFGFHFDSESFLQTKSNPDPSSLYRVAVVGHRKWIHDESVNRRIIEAIEQLVSENRGKRLMFLSSLAEGADMLVVELAIEHHPNSLLKAILPMPPSTYFDEFTNDQNIANFHALLARATDIQVIESTGISSTRTTRPKAYENAARAVVAEADAIIAIWDGRPARGVGGSAFSIDLARRQAKPIMHIQVQRE